MHLPSGFRVVVAPDKFKGSLQAGEVCEVVCGCIETVPGTVVDIPGRNRIQSKIIDNL